MSEEVFQQMLNIIYSPEMQKYINYIKSIAGYKLDQIERQPFLKFHNFITNPQPVFISQWRSDDKLEKWYHRFVNGILGDVQNTYTCVKYHFDNLNKIEKHVINGLTELDFEKWMENSTMAIGNTLKWDFEYQAFILAYRRCLDHFARGVASYFKNDFHSFRNLGEFLAKQREGMTSLEKLIIFHKKYSSIFKFVLSEGDRKSIRDKISHYEYVSVGTLNIQGKGPVLVGGEEKLDGTGQVILSDVLQNYKDNLHSCISEMLSGFIDFIKEDQKD